MRGIEVFSPVGDQDSRSYYPLLAGASSRPPWGCASFGTTADAEAVLEKANGRLYSLLFFATSGSAQLTVRAHEGRGTRPMGDGAAAWNAVNERFDAQNQEARRACHNELFNLRHKTGGDPINFYKGVGPLASPRGAGGGGIRRGLLGHHAERSHGSA